MTHPEFSPQDAERFWSRIDRSGGLDACWPWTAGSFSGGYGAFAHGGKSLKSHRIAFFLERGHWPVCACHHCDFPPCCNPAHLFDGTPLDNIRDAVAKDRMNRIPGEDRWTSKLTDAQVMEIRRRYADGERIAAIAADFPVTDKNVFLIGTGQSWTHLPAIAPTSRRYGQTLEASVVADVESRRRAGQAYGRIAADLGIGKSSVARIAAAIGQAGPPAPAAHIAKVCPTCETEFTVTPAREHTARYCSYPCAHKGGTKHGRYAKIHV